MKEILTAIFLIAISAVSTVIFAEPTNVCRWTSEFECKDKTIGSSCSSSGTCFVKEWAYSEPVCKCYEKPDDSKNYCSSTNDSECRDKLPHFVGFRVCSALRLVWT